MRSPHCLRKLAAHAVLCLSAHAWAQAPAAPPASAPARRRLPPVPRGRATPRRASSRPAGDGEPAAVCRGRQDARRTDGLFPLWQKDDKVWLGIAESDLNQPFFFSPAIKTGIGENYFFGGMLGFDDGIVEFRRIHNQIQLLWRNTEFLARPGSPEAFAVQAAFSPNLIASTAVASQPHPERKTFLVEANAFFVMDLTGMASQLQRTYRQGYAFDSRNSAITALRNAPDATTFEVLNHFAAGSITPPTSAPPGTPVPSIPRSPDPRSLFITLRYTLARLPAQPIRPRLSDARLSHFTVSVVDFGDDLAQPAPALRQPLEAREERTRRPSSPSQCGRSPSGSTARCRSNYRAAVTDGARRNKAFGAIGFGDALRVEVSPTTPRSTLDHGARRSAG